MQSGKNYLKAAYEATARPKYYFRGIYLLVVVTIAVSLTLMSMYTFLLLIQASPLWDPRYVIPICGMMLGNNVSAVSLALNSLLTNLNERREDVELLITFGGTRFEASLPFLREAVRVGLTPTLNQMVVIGIVSLPGMMTGQILGGRYFEAISTNLSSIISCLQEHLPLRQRAIKF